MQLSHPVVDLCIVCSNFEESLTFLPRQTGIRGGTRHRHSRRPSDGDRAGAARLQTGAPAGGRDADQADGYRRAARRSELPNLPLGCAGSPSSSPTWKAGVRRIAGERRGVPVRAYGRPGYAGRRLYPGSRWDPHRTGSAMKIADIRTIPLVGATPDGGWEQGYDPGDNLHTLVEDYHRRKGLLVWGPSLPPPA